MQSLKKQGISPVRVLGEIRKSEAGNPTEMSEAILAYDLEDKN